jgi:prepilin-type N-terminal cleavage/methylation domain-containing protein
MRPGGFTLLEMIVVLAILGLAAALVGPSMVRSIDTWRRQAAMDVLLDQQRALPGNARGSGKQITVSDATLASATPPLRIDADWTLHAPEPWSVGANGVCQGGEVIIRNAYGERSIRVAAPFCDPTVQP